jgi:hypothetical protein
MKLLAPYLLFSIMVLSLTCRKKMECGNAELCLTNNTADTIYYSWGGTVYADTLLPGNKTCHSFGPMTPFSNAEQIWADFNTSNGNYRFLVTDCHQELNIQ